MSRVSLADLCDEANGLISELQGQVNAIRNNMDLTFMIEREVYMMGYVAKRLTRLQKNLMERVDKESCDQI